MSGKGNGCKTWDSVSPIFSRAKVKTKVNVQLLYLLFVFILVGTKIAGILHLISLLKKVIMLNCILL